MTGRIFALLLAACAIFGAGYGVAYRARPSDPLTVEQKAYYDRLVAQQSADYRASLDRTEAANAEAQKLHAAKENAWYASLAEMVARDYRRGTIRPSLAQRMLSARHEGRL